MSAKLTTDLIGIAGVHFVAYRLALRGWIVVPTSRNTASIDILIHDRRTGDHAAVQVKTSLEKVKYWPASKPDNCLRGLRTFHVFLRYDNEIDTFEAFLETGDRVAEQVKQNVADYSARGLKEFSYWELPQDTAETERLRRAWHEWSPSSECDQETSGN